MQAVDDNMQEVTIKTEKLSNDNSYFTDYKLYLLNDRLVILGSKSGYFGADSFPIDVTDKIAKIVKEEINKNP